MELIVEILAKAISFFSKNILRRGGETWPGELAMRLYPHIGHRLGRYFDGIIYVVGTNGKTSTCKLITQVLSTSGRTIITNPTGANQLNGIISCILTHKKFFGHTRYFGVFEVDENSLPEIVRTMPPTAVIILNILRDQMDRYGEVNAITARWKEALNCNRKVVLIANAFDPGVFELAESLDPEIEKHYYGVPEAFLQKANKEVGVLGDFVYCPHCNTRFSYKGRFVSHIGAWFCEKCGFRPKNVFRFTPAQVSELESLPAYFVINSQSVFLLAQKLLVNEKRVIEELLNWEPAFGRGESVTVGGKTFVFYLGKNPSSWTVVFESLFKGEPPKADLVLGLNNRIPDGHDVSWIWDIAVKRGKMADFKSHIYVFGDRAYDMAQRLQIEGARVTSVEPKTSELVCKLRESDGKKFVIIANYSALLEIRKEVTGKAIL